MKRLSIGLLAYLLVALLLAGCAPWDTGPQQPSARLHDLGPDPEQMADAPPMRVERLRSPTWLEGDRILYRRLAGDPTELRSYARHRWLATPPELVGRRLDAAFPASGERNALSLRGELATFEQHFRNDDQSTAVVRLRAVLSRDGAVLAARNFTVTESAEPGVDGAITGLAAATDRLAAEVAEWAATAP